jgi:phosphoglycolate phosphatase-like HAD superfamily hydrolase
MRAHPATPIVFFGDAIGDLQAAQAAGVAFVAVVNECDNFRQLDVIMLNDFTQLREVERAIQAALAGMAATSIT